MRGSADIIISTISKALGGACEGFVGSLIKMLRIRSRSYIYLNAIDPSSVAGALKALQLLKMTRPFLKHCTLRKLVHFKKGAHANDESLTKVVDFW